MQRQRRIIARFDSRREPSHQSVEPVGLLNQSSRELERKVALQIAFRIVVNRNCDDLMCQQVLRFGTQLERVAQVDRHIHVNPGSAGGFEGFAGGEGPGGAGEVDGGGVYVDADDVGEQAVEDLCGLAARVFGGGEIFADGGEDEGAGAAGGVEHALVERIGDDGVDDFAGEPVGRVVLAKASAVVGGDDGFVEDACDIGFGLFPVEAGDAAGEAVEPCAAFDFGRPGEEVGFDDAAHAGFLDEQLPAE